MSIPESIEGNGPGEQVPYLSSHKAAEIVKDAVDQSLAVGQLRSKIFDFFISLIESDPRIATCTAFGSSGTGEYTFMSDVDMLVVVKGGHKQNVLNHLLQRLRNHEQYLWDWEYTGTHYYIVFSFLLPLDLYIISEDEVESIYRDSDRNEPLFHILRKQEGTRLLVDNSRLDAPIINEPDSKVIGKKYTEEDADIEYFQKGITRLYRLLSKLEKGEYVEFVYILNAIRDDNILPLLSTIGYKFQNAKKVQLGELPEDMRNCYINTFVGPTHTACAKGLESAFLLMELLLGIYFEKHLSSNVGSVCQWFTYAKRHVNKLLCNVS